MNGYDIFLRAAAMLGFTRDVAERTGLTGNAGGMLRELCMDLGVEPLEALSEALSVTPAQNEALLYGMAMLMALACGDGAANRYYTSLYNAKRARAKACVGKIADVLPRDNGGVRS
ncbi:MAG: hypothetical protein MJ132_06040 [Clostridia bacterium]|nr:hypothetical protein [Clostridia bacterium]